MYPWGDIGIAMGAPAIGGMLPYGPVMAGAPKTPG
jgi:hypothetical protein